MRPYIAYLTYDLNDPATRRRIEMFVAGGAHVLAIGFRRAERPRLDLMGAAVVELGRTYPGRFFHRAATLFKSIVLSGRWSAKIRCADVVVARNLESLVLAWAVLRIWPSTAKLIYECLDIHDLMVSRSFVGMSLRAVERYVMHRCSRVMVSSPAFEKYYFRAVQETVIPVQIVENKVFSATKLVRPEDTASPPSPPWKICWLGNLRCNKSLAQMVELSRLLGGLIEFDLWGVPAYHEFSDFDAQVASSPYITYRGPYNFTDLPEIYRNYHFVWAVDFSQEGRNSKWLLPNRLYEGMLYGCVPLGLRSVETGSWLAGRGAGVLFDSVIEELSVFFVTLDMLHFIRLKEAVVRLPDESLVTSQAECEELVNLFVAS